MINMNFSEQVVCRTTEQPWQESPANGVYRKPLAREFAESGHASSIVKYQPGTAFNEHSHPLGEEIFVLEGVFSDEHGDYPQGSYLRNPAGTKHSPFSKNGCTLFVKLNQFQAGDSQQIVIDTNNTTWTQGIGGLQVMPLHSFKTQHTALVKWPKEEKFQPHSHFGGEEILVLSGEFIDEHGHYPKGTWIRSPHMSRHDPFVEQETVILVKTGHVPF